MTEYQSIKPDVLALLEAHLPEIRERFGIETLGIFGSVSRGEDTPDSDVDILFTFRKGCISFANAIYLEAYLEKLLGRKIDLIPEDALSKYMLPDIQKDVISVAA